jgi:transcriptional regulator with XRE-family HTH domain
MRPTKQTPLGELSQGVKNLREVLGQTQQQFALTLGTAITTIARYETGREPHGRSLASLAEVAEKHGYKRLAKTFRTALVKELGWRPTFPSCSIKNGRLEFRKPDGTRVSLMDIVCESTLRGGGHYECFVVADVPQVPVRYEEQ